MKPTAKEKSKPTAPLGASGARPLSLGDLTITWGGTDDEPKNTITGNQVARLLDVMRHVDFDPSETDHGGDMWPLGHNVELSPLLRGVGQLIDTVDEIGGLPDHFTDHRLYFLASAQRLLAACVMAAWDSAPRKMYRVHVGRPPAAKAA